MPVTEKDVAALAKYVHAAPAEEYVKESAAEAFSMVANHTKPENVRGEIPEHILQRAQLEVGAELYHRRTARNGIVAMEGGPENLTPMRIARDPMKAAYDILRPYMTPAIS